MVSVFFFFNDPATTEIYPLPLHDALPISSTRARSSAAAIRSIASAREAPRVMSLNSSGSSWIETVLPASTPDSIRIPSPRSEEHTSELQSQSNLVCRLLLEKKKKNEKHRESYTH